MREVPAAPPNSVDDSVIEVAAEDSSLSFDDDIATEDPFPAPEVIPAPNRTIAR